MTYHGEYYHLEGFPLCQLQYNNPVHRFTSRLKVRRHSESSPTMRMVGSRSAAPKVRVMKLPWTLSGNEIGSWTTIASQSAVIQRRFHACTTSDGHQLRHHLHRLPPSRTL
jgi:hypothetical protein